MHPSKRSYRAPPLGGLGGVTSLQKKSFQSGIGIGSRLSGSMDEQRCSVFHYGSADTVER